MRTRRRPLTSLYLFSFLLTAVVFLAVGFFGGPEALLTVLVLSALEITFSFDNAIVNAKVLAGMPEFWRRMFMTTGILIAVFVVRLLLPIVLVAATAGLSMEQVVQLALQRPAEYARYLDQAHPIIASFGGMFLLMIFLEFILDNGRRVQWFRGLERPLMKVGRLRQVSPLLSLSVLALATQLLGRNDKLEVIVAGVIGVITYLAVRSFAEIFELKQEKESRHKLLARRTLMRAGLVSFLYLELLDASFSLDGVIGAFAITNAVPLITAGLGVGAVWVRSMTIHVARRDVLVKYRYLDHGAHYAIGALAAVLLLGIRYEIPEAVTGTIGVIIIGFALFSSWRYNVRHEPERVEAHRR